MRGILRGMGEEQIVKMVGRRQSLGNGDPREFLMRAMALQESVERLNPYPKPRGFVFKARTWEDYERWRKSQSNPRLW